MNIFKGKKLNLTKRRIARSRRAFGFRTHEAQVRLAKFRGKHRVFRPAKSGKKIFAERDLLRQEIFHSLFPQNSLTPLGIAFVEEGGKHVWGVVTKIVHKRSSDYKRAQKLFYTDLSKYYDHKDEAVARHEDFVRDVAMPLSFRIRQEAGIDFDNAPVNVCNVEGTPVFFEVSDLWPRVCEKYIERTVANKAKKKRLLDSLQRLEYIERNQLHRQ